jgi:hypothetical protein
MSTPHEANRNAWRERCWWWRIILNTAYHSLARIRVYVLRSLLGARLYKREIHLCFDRRWLDTAHRGDGKSETRPLDYTLQ